MTSGGQGGNFGKLSEDPFAELLDESNKNTNTMNLSGLGMKT